MPDCLPKLGYCLTFNAINNNLIEIYHQYFHGTDTYTAGLPVEIHVCI